MISVKPRLTHVLPHKYLNIEKLAAVIYDNRVGYCIKIYKSNVRYWYLINNLDLNETNSSCSQLLKFVRNNFMDKNKNCVKNFANVDFKFILFFLNEAMKPNVYIFVAKFFLSN